MKKEILIKVIAAAGHGKSTVAQIVKQALLDNGITNINLIDVDMGAYEGESMKKHLPRRIEALQDAEMTVETVQLHRTGTVRQSISEQNQKLI
jgi:adenylate kinase